MAILSLPRNEFSSKASVQLGLREIRMIESAEGETYLSKIYLEESKYFDDAGIFSDFGDLSEHSGEYDKALEWYQKGLDIQLKTLGAEHPNVSNSFWNIGNCQKELQIFIEAIQSFKSGFAIEKKGGYLFQIAECYEALSENLQALDYYIQSAEIRNDDPDAGIEAESTQQSIKACIRLAKELGKEDELPQWIKEKY